MNWGVSLLTFIKLLLYIVNDDVMLCVIQSQQYGYTNVTRRIFPYTNVTRRTFSYTNVTRRTFPYTNVTRRTFPYTNVIRRTFPYTNVIRRTFPYTNVTRRVFHYTNVTRRTFPYTNVTRRTFPYIGPPVHILDIDGNPFEMAPLQSLLLLEHFLCKCHCFHLSHITTLIRKCHLVVHTIPKWPCGHCTVDQNVDIWPQEYIISLPLTTKAASYKLSLELFIILQPMCSNCNISVIMYYWSQRAEYFIIAL